MENLGSKELQALKERLSKFDISVSKGVDGNYTVSTACEPFFCFERKTISELQTLVSNTLASYAATFYNVTDLKFSVSIEPARETPIPIEERVISSRFVPVFARNNDALELV